MERQDGVRGAHDLRGTRFHPRGDRRLLRDGLVDEVVVVDNNAEPGTREQVERTTARLVHEPWQGYGFATRRGLVEAKGDLVVLAEPDGTFLPADQIKLLVYSAECDAVFGTRTTRDLIWAGAHMSWFLRWGNWAVAKLIESLSFASTVVGAPGSGAAESRSGTRSMARVYPGPVRAGGASEVVFVAA